ncbi:hypothetical protein ACP0HM_33445 [Escherichia coli]
MITDASVEVGPALFISLLIITLSFIPIFTTEGQGRASVWPVGVHQKRMRWRVRRCWRS